MGRVIQRKIVLGVWSQRRKTSLGGGESRNSMQVLQKSSITWLAKSTYMVICSSLSCQLSDFDLNEPTPQNCFLYVHIIFVRHSHNKIVYYFEQFREIFKPLLFLHVFFYSRNSAAPWRACIAHIFLKLRILF